jgi:hypothetical protein
MVAAVGARQRGLFLRTDGADHRCAQMLQPLAGDQPDPAGGGMEQDGLAGLHPEGAADQIMHGHALQHHAGGLGVGDPVRQAA